jgi:hypothetical protein
MKMTDWEAAGIYKAFLNNPNLTEREIITHYYKSVKGATDEEIEDLIKQYESRKKNNVPFDPSGKTDVETPTPATSNFEFGDSSTRQEPVETISSDIAALSPDFGGFKVEEPTEKVNTDNLVFGEGETPKQVKSDEPISFPNTESGLNIVGQEPKIEEVKSDDFVFGEGEAPKQVKSDEPISFPNTESGLNIVGQEPKPVQVNTDNLTFGEGAPAKPTDGIQPVDFPNEEINKENGNGPEVPPEKPSPFLGF